MNSFQPWRRPYDDDARSVDSSSASYWQPGAQAAPSGRGEEGKGGAVTPPAPPAGRPHGRLLASYAPPSSATLSEDEEGEGGVRGATGQAAPVASKPPAKPLKPAASAADAQLAELRSRIREDTLACRQFAAETEEQWAHLGALRKELDALSGTVSALGARRGEVAAEAEEEERRVLEARRLRSSLRKALHDAQKRVDGAGHRSRAALSQLQRLLVTAGSFVGSEEEALGGGAAGEAGTAAAAADAAHRSASGALAAATAGGDWEDTASLLSDRYSVTGDSAGAAPPPPGGLLARLAHFAKSVLRLRLVVSFNEVSLTMLPGQRRRRGSRRRAARAARPRPTLREIEELPDAAAASDGEGGSWAAETAGAAGAAAGAGKAGAKGLEERAPTAAAGRARAELRPTRAAPPPPPAVPSSLPLRPSASPPVNRYARLVSVAGEHP